MALTITRVDHPTGARRRSHKGESFKTFKIVGDGVGGTASLGYGDFRRFNRAVSPYEYTINTTNKTVDVVVPAGLSALEAVNVELSLV